MAKENLDALVVCGNEYTGFEGAIRYVSDFEIVHRYVYVLIPLEGDPVLLFPRRSPLDRRQKKPWVKRTCLGRHSRQMDPRTRAIENNWKRLGVYGLNYIMAVRDYRDSWHRAPSKSSISIALSTWPAPSKAKKNSPEFATHGNHRRWFLGHGRKIRSPEKPKPKSWRRPSKDFLPRGAGLRMMNIVLSGDNGEAEAMFKVPAPSQSQAPTICCSTRSKSPAPTATGWNFRAPLIQGKISARTAAMAEIYPEATRSSARKDARRRAGQRMFIKRRRRYFCQARFQLGHLSGHSIGMTMIEYPAIGANTEIELRENMIFSFHPQVVMQDGKVCLYTQDTYRVGKKEGENLGQRAVEILCRRERPSAMRSNA